MRMEGADIPSRAPRTLFSLNSTEEISRFATGCDSDNGGMSTVNFGLDKSSESNPIIGKPTAKFWGQMNLAVKPGSKLTKGGYAALKSKVRIIFETTSVRKLMKSQDRPTLFGHDLENLELHRYLALRLRLSGDPRTHNSYFVNIQIEGPFETDLWQHRLYFKKRDSWEDIFVNMWRSCIPSVC